MGLTLKFPVGDQFSYTTSHNGPYLSHIYVAIIMKFSALIVYTLVMT